MSGVYSVEDLLKLRASPLICKPPNLPPIEEWMGSQEPSAKRPTTRGRQEETPPAEGFQKRPTLDPSRKSTTDPERIVLGPPRRSFASSNARNWGKAGTNDTEESQKETTGRHERIKTGEDLDNKLGDRKSGQFGATARYSGRHDQDQDRPRRRHDEEEGEGRSRREHDRPRWGRDEKGSEEVDENANLKSSFRRDPQARSRFEQSWIRNDRGPEEGRRDNERPGWRRDRVKDGDWDMPGKGEMDPEWMDAPDTTEPAQAHTQEDFQRWKERMKAAANGTTEEKPEASIPKEQVSFFEQATLSANVVSPDMKDNSMDKFFAKFTEKRNTTEDKAPTAKPATKSKFASLFSPQAETKPESIMFPPMPTSPVTTSRASDRTPAPVAEPVAPVVDADQAGFKRILEMLGNRDTAPAEETLKTKSTPSGIEQQSHERHQSPDLVALFKQGQPSRQALVSPQPTPSLERLIESRSPAHGHRRQETPNKDELLLNLLRQADISAKPQPPPQPQRDYTEQRPPPGLFASMTDPGRGESHPIYDERLDMERQGRLQQRGGRPMYDEAAISGVPYHEEMGNRQGLQRRPTGGYEDAYFDRLRQQEQKPRQPPPGVPVPPGFEQISRMPPGWPGQPQPPPQQQTHQHQQPSRPGPPPGINMPRGMQPPYGAPQQGPMPPMQQQGQRPPQRKYTGESGMPNFPPGIGPPPGFMNNPPPPPPPGFHHSGAPGQPQSYGRYGIGGDGQGPPQQPPPPNIGRGFMEMYSNTDRANLRGGNGGVQLPPGFR